jgi:hypothetical protein
MNFDSEKIAFGYGEQKTIPKRHFRRFLASVDAVKVRSRPL